jgi:beta-glucosidase/6-phospho-beta-glucosidase/beta-galactosidase
VVLVVPELHRRHPRAGRYSVTDGVLAAHHLLLGHGLAVRSCATRDAALSLGITLNLTVADAVDPADPADVDAARRIDGQFNRWFLDPIFRGAYPADVSRTSAPSPGGDRRARGRDRPATSTSSRRRSTRSA